MIRKNRKYIDLQKKILHLGLVIPGTIRKVYLKCGKESCSCASDNKDERHGPYFFWDRKIDGQLSSLSISKKDLPYYKQGIANRRMLEKLIATLFNTGTQLATQFKKRAQQNSKKVRLQPQKSKIKSSK